MKMIEELLNKVNLIDQKLNVINQKIDYNKRNSNEIIYAHIFKSTISNSEWLNDKNLSPRGAAIGYSGLYCMYRILNDIKPKKILELGLGQSTKIIQQFVDCNEGTKHIVVENDQDWIDFFSDSTNLSKSTEIMKLHYKFANYKNVPNVRMYADFQKNLQDKKFDFIFIDAPLGIDMPIICRVDILGILPNSLEESFVILVDDYDRKTEQRMVEELISKLKQNNINFCKGVYSGAKDVCVICSIDYKFLTTL